MPVPVSGPSGRKKKNKDRSCWGRKGIPDLPTPRDKKGKKEGSEMQWKAGSRAVPKNGFFKAGPTHAKHSKTRPRHWIHVLNAHIAGWKRRGKKDGNDSQGRTSNAGRPKKTRDS